MTRIAIIGGGPTGIYALKALIAAPLPLDITLFEREPWAGPGMPYRDGMNDPVMLSNIAGREIPQVTRGLTDFLKDCDEVQLRTFGLKPADIDDDSFYPRLVLGSYFTAELAQLVARGRARGHRVNIRTKARVTDILPLPAGPRVTWQGPEAPEHADFDHVIIATGHDWTAPEPEESPLLSPWPAERLRALTGRIGILGSSLSAIDVAVTAAAAHGDFIEDGGALAYAPHQSDLPLHFTMMSRKALLPEADWYYPLPLPDLPSFTEPAAARMAARGPRGLLDRAFAVFAADLAQTDPDYAAGLDLSTPESFAESHFAPRMAADPWDHARRDLAEAARNRDAGHAVPWRLVLLAAHEVFEALTPHFTEADLARFGASLKPVFSDGYASVPHRSIQRLLALRDAGRLDLLRLPADHQAERHGAQTLIRHGDSRHLFDAVVDARGQAPRRLSDLGFRTLARHVRPGWERDGYRLPLAPGAGGSVHCLALPVLLARRPFVQGLVNAAEMGEAAARAILAELPSGPGTPGLAAARAQFTHIL